MVEIIGYIQGLTQKEIFMAVHKCAKFSNNPQLMHGCAIIQIEKHLVSTRTIRLSTYWVIYKNNKEKGIEYYVDTNFSSGWAQADVNNVENAVLRMGYRILYTRCPLLWFSKLQIEKVLILVEAGYIDFSQAMRDVLPLMALLKEVSFI